MRLVVVVAVSYLLTTSHAAVIKKEAHPNITQPELIQLQEVKGMPDFSQIMQNFNVGQLSANKDAAKMIDEYTKMMQQRLEEMTREMTKNMDAFGTTSEMVDSKRSGNKVTVLKRGEEGTAGAPSFTEGMSARLCQDDSRIQ